MENNIEIIKRAGKRFVVVPESIYNDLIEDAEMLEDIRSYDEAKARNEETFGEDFVGKILKVKKGSERIAVWREHRGLSKAALGKAIGKNGQYIGMIEGGKRKGTIATIRDIAKALKCDVDDLI